MNENVEAEQKKELETWGRPKIDREKIWNLLKQKECFYCGRLNSEDKLECTNCGKRRFAPMTKTKIARRLGVSVPTIYRAIEEIPQGFKAVEITTTFDEVSKDLKGFLESRLKKGTHQTGILNFIKEVWTNVWNRKKLENLDDNDIINAVAYIRQKYQGPSVRRHIIALRYPFRISKNPDARVWLETHLKTVGLARSIRRIDWIADRDFPQKMFQVIKEATALALAEEKLEIEVILLVKIYTGIRTGSFKEERELWGTKIGSGKTSISVINSRIIWHVLAKKNEEWDITQYPEIVGQKLKELMALRQHGEPLIKMPIKRAIDLLAQACEKVGIPVMTLHDLRKVYGTWLALSGIEMLVASALNVGWTDLNTMKIHYAHINVLALGQENYAKLLAKFSPPSL